MAIDENVVGSSGQPDKQHSTAPSLTESESSSPPEEFDLNIGDDIVSSLESLAPSSSSLNNAEDGLMGAKSESSPLAESSISIDSNQEFLASPITISDQNYIKCPVCERHRKLFYCCNCIHDGNFVNSHHNLPETFAEKKLKLLKIQEEARQLEEEFEKMHIQQAHEHEMMQMELRTVSGNCKLLKILLQDEKKRLFQSREKIQRNEDSIKMHAKNRKSKAGKLQLINNFITSRKASIVKRENERNRNYETLKEMLQYRIYRLSNDIFPIEEINLDEPNILGLSSHSGCGVAGIETFPLLTFSDDNTTASSKISGNSIGGRQFGYSIVEPWLPSDGDYSQYIEWINEHKDLMPASLGQLGERNAAFRISAGLAYLTQLVNKLAYHLDVILPMRMSLDTFVSDLLSETQFAYNVAKLNANVVQLALSQGIDISLIKPKRTIYNLLLLFDQNVCTLGRNGPFEFDDDEHTQELCRRIEDFLMPDLSLISEDPAYDSIMKTSCYDEISDSEWELSDSISPGDVQSMLDQSAQQTTSIIGLPYRFLTSFWTSK